MAWRTHEHEYNQQLTMRDALIAHATPCRPRRPGAPPTGVFPDTSPSPAVKTRPLLSQKRSFLPFIPALGEAGSQFDSASLLRLPVAFAPTCGVGFAACQV